MEQTSNVYNRAEKEYKNGREKFYLLLREILSNSIQAVLIRKEKEKEKRRAYSPELTLVISVYDKECRIVLEDNGEGFTRINSNCFDELDKKNLEKLKYNFHPLGQGRLAIVYYTDEAYYETVYRNDEGELKKKEFQYPNPNEGLFSLALFEDDITDVKDTYTKLKIVINQQNKYSRAKTFFKKHESINELKQWFIENFFPYIVTNDDLKVHLIYNNEKETITQKSIENETEQVDFTAAPDGNDNYGFKIWLIKSNDALRGDNPITCFARCLKAELANGKLFYNIDSENGFLLYLTSDYFDDNVDNKGERIEISSDAISEINNCLKMELDKRFKDIIENNQKTTQRNYDSFKKKFPSLDAFLPSESLASGNNIVDEDTLIKTAIETKGKYEKKFWTQMNKPINEKEEKPYDESEECQKLLNSSLHIYVKHRERVLERLHDLIRKYDDEGNDKSELESSVQELLFRRGETLKDSDNINHLHNLWILDDKFTTFSDSMKAKSTKSGEKRSDIYIWADDLEDVKQLLILELKSTNKAHNAGDKYESMIAQVKRYAKDFYNNPVKTLDWDVNTTKVQYLGIILARKSDIKKEVTSPNVNGTYESIPFLEDSFYKDDFYYPNENDTKLKVSIRIELYSFEDIYKLASSRNSVFFKLLKKEFGVSEDEQFSQQ